MALLPIGTRLMPIGIKTVTSPTACTVACFEILGDQANPFVITGYNKTKNRYLTNLDTSHISSVFRDHRGIAVDRVGLVEEYQTPTDVEYHILVPYTDRDAGFLKVKTAMLARLKNTIQETQAFLLSLQKGSERLEESTSEILDEVFHVKMPSPEEIQGDANNFQL